MTRSCYLDIITQFLALGVREGMMLTPGEALDLQTLEIERRGLRRKEAIDDGC